MSENRAIDSGPPSPTLFYDGTCGLCHAAVRRVLASERAPTLRFAPLGGETARALSGRFPEIGQAIDSLIFIEDGRLHLRSRAVFHIARHLRAPWRWSAPLRHLPGWLVDGPYRLVARLRYRLWGRREACTLPAPEARARFLP